MGWREKVKRAQRLHRPSLKDWECDGLHAKFPDFVKSVSSRSKCELFQQPNGSSDSTNIPAVFDVKDVSLEDFVDHYEAKGIPAVIRGIPDGDIVTLSLNEKRTMVNGTNKKKLDGEVVVKNEKGALRWPASKEWDLIRLESSTLRNRYFKCGEDDDGRSVKIKLKHFLKYLRENRDDSPLYIFDSVFDEDKVSKKLLDDYRVPTYFSEDLFHLVGERRRPPYRWFLVGPERSGTTIHIDPLGTSAWNTLLFGKKRWVLFPPGTPKSIVKGKGLIGKDEDDEAIHYFMTILPRIKKSAFQKKECQNFKCYEFTQDAGETVFIPNGWWHAVLNLTHTVGVTQNFCSERNFDEAWVKTRVGRKKMAYKWLSRLEIEYPHLAERAKEMNKRDEFVMKYDTAVRRKREEEERRGRKENDKRRHAKKDAKVSTKQHDDRKERHKAKKRKRAKNHKSCNLAQSQEDVRETKRRRFASRLVSPE